MHRRRLGSELRRIRESAGRTHREVAAHLDCSQGKISQIELGRVPVRTSDVRLMAEFYGVGPDGLDQLLDLAQDSKQRGWWQQYPSTAQVPGLQTYLGLETAAKAVSCYGAAPLPDLLQTAEYCHALRSTEVAPRTEDELGELEQVLTARQQRLVGDNPLELWAVLDESALRRAVGGPAVQRRQLEHLVLLGYRRNVTIQVLPFEAGGHPLMSDRIAVFSFPDDADPQVVHLGDSANSRFLDKHADTADYLKAFEQVCTRALNPKDSSAHISTLADQLK
ncbi:helix-turn-helix domain-containing protein [Saccharopolyspora sp. HNM0983]|uniref:Helix-turn-helix domain-containing protein n=1 Tax=Saccharopolyspora montiporae TaxID=2781240 RepID=A0A929G0G6_9PSEU|nr:helix-turn-helix domain-containing protein [Saccharopolyspora sp. HNM0983]